MFFAGQAKQAYNNYTSSTKFSTMVPPTGVPAVVPRLTRFRRWKVSNIFFGAIESKIDNTNYHVYWQFDCQSSVGISWKSQLETNQLRAWMCELYSTQIFRSTLQPVLRLRLNTKDLATNMTFLKAGGVNGHLGAQASWCLGGPQMAYRRSGPIRIYNKHAFAILQVHSRPAILCAFII